jgi:hypothetical protein
MRSVLADLLADPWDKRWFMHSLQLLSPCLSRIVRQIDRLTERLLYEPTWPKQASFCGVQAQIEAKIRRVARGEPATRDKF